MSTKNENIPEGYNQLELSERRPVPGARLVGPADPNEILSVFIYVRRRPDGPPLPGHEYWMKHPSKHHKPLSHEELHGPSLIRILFYIFLLRNCTEELSKEKNANPNFGTVIHGPD